MSEKKFNYKASRRMWTAIEKKNCSALKKALYEGADPNYIQTSRSKGALVVEDGDLFSTPAIVKAAALQFGEGVDYLIQAGADVKACDSDGTTALHNAVRPYFPPAILLIQAGADPFAENNWGMTPAAQALEMMVPDIILQTMLEYGADPNHYIDDMNCSFLVLAAMMRDFSKMEMLFKYGAKFKDQNEKKRCLEIIIENYRRYEKFVPEELETPEPEEPVQDKGMTQFKNLLPFRKETDAAVNTSYDDPEDDYPKGEPIMLLVDNGLDISFQDDEGNDLPMILANALLSYRDGDDFYMGINELLENGAPLFTVNKDGEDLIALLDKGEYIREGLGFDPWVTPLKELIERMRRQAKEKK